MCRDDPDRSDDGNLEIVFAASLTILANHKVAGLGDQDELLSRRSERCFENVAISQGVVKFIDKIGRLINFGHSQF